MPVIPRSMRVGVENEMMDVDAAAGTAARLIAESGGADHPLLDPLRGVTGLPEASAAALAIRREMGVASAPDYAHTDTSAPWGPGHHGSPGSAADSDLRSAVEALAWLARDVADGVRPDGPIDEIARHLARRAARLWRARTEETGAAPYEEIAAVEAAELRRLRGLLGIPEGGFPD